MKQTTATTVLSGRPAVEQCVFELTDEQVRREETPQRVLQQRAKGLQREV